ncbi:PUA domain-containing protein [Archaeoglobus veneficus]|uniref:PUA domain-containing protein n=1 Tax=Archaeoglobus veneficus (strain DSM 11195 / SNP6) TaxID=693661 RepID=F2KNX8_ARCVS|nr:NIP7 N-terminal domain-related protein [Archaeoglobus veneficus]AEA47455.1 protein of unknown function UPF0113 [Archaeoglobus veneficus SNP6]
MVVDFRLRGPKRREEKTIKKALSAYDSLDFLENNVILIRDGELKEVFGLARELDEFLQRFPGLNLRHAGIKLGEVGRRFRFSIEGTFFLAKKESKRVYLSEKGEMLFLYGRDVFASSVIGITEDTGENDIVMVCNENGDILGIGKSRFDWHRMMEMKEKDPDRVVVENLLDRGEYLRKEKLYNAY